MVSRAPRVPSNFAVSTGLLGVLLCACPPGPLTGTESDSATSSGSTTANTTEPTGGAEDGLFACAAPPCTLLLVSQTLDDRIDVYDVGPSPHLRGRIGTDLKPDPSGAQTMGNLLDEPYGLAFDGTHLWAAIGHYPDTDSGSLLAYPRSAFAGLAPGAVFSEDMYFGAGTFSAGVQSLPFAREEAIFLLPHPSGRLLIGVFANNLQSATWTEPSELLVVDPADLTPAALGSFSLDLDTAPCKGGWKLVALDDAVSRVALACDGSESVAVVTLPDDFADAAPTAAAAGMSACGLNLAASGSITTQFVAPDGAGGLLAVQSQITEAPRLWSVTSGCAPAGAPGSDLPAELAQVRIVREPVLLRAGSPPMWLVASESPAPGVLIVRGGATPAICGQVSGLDTINTSTNGPFALALDAARTHLAIGAGPVSNPPFAEGRGQVLWATLDTSKLDDCEVTASAVVDLTEGSFASADPRTWVRAPNVLVIAELGGS